MTLISHTGEGHLIFEPANGAALWSPPSLFGLCCLLAALTTNGCWYCPLCGKLRVETRMEEGGAGQVWSCSWEHLALRCRERGMVGERPPAAAKTATCYAAHCVHAELTGIGLPECVRRVIKQAFKRLTPSLKINADVLDGLNFFFYSLCFLAVKLPRRLDLQTMKTWIYWRPGSWFLDWLMSSDDQRSHVILDGFGSRPDLSQISG